MHNQTEQAVLNLLLAEGLPSTLRSAVRRLFLRIQEGHTAVLLGAEEQDAWEQSPWATGNAAMAPLWVTNGWLQTGRHRAQEARVAGELKRRAASIATDSLEPLALMPQADASQQAAIVGAMSRQLSLILGGPGSGKTTTAAAIIAAKYHQLSHIERPAIALLAPTGKAAVRLTESFQNALARMPESLKPVLDAKATTIHRQLDQLGDCDLILVDEASMVSLDLMDRMLSRLRPEAHLILMGDPHQLASVEAGSVLSTLAHSAAFTSDRFILTGRHRTEAGRGLNQIQDLCLAGDLEGFKEALQALQIPWMQPQGGASLEAYIQDGYAPYFSAIQAGQTRAIPAFQCLTSISSGVGGRHWVNRLVSQQAAARGLDGLGHRILITENQPALDLYNGDIGVYQHRQTDPAPEIWISGSERTVQRHQINQPETAYAISIHRSQGSEYADVLVCLPEPPERSRYQPSRELLYTALTRAKQSIALFASESQLAAALATPTHRDSCLEHFLAEG